ALPISVDPAQGDGDLDLALGRDVLALQTLQDGDRLVAIAARLRGEGQPDFRVLTETGQTCQVVVSEQLREAVAGLRDLTVLQCHPGLTEGKFDYLHPLRRPSVDHIGVR